MVLKDNQSNGAILLIPFLISPGQIQRELFCLHLYALTSSYQKSPQFDWHAILQHFAPLLLDTAISTALWDLEPTSAKNTAPGFIYDEDE